MSLRGLLLWRVQDGIERVLSRLLWPRPTAFVVAEYDGELLAIDTGDYLMLPGGGVEPGEDFREAAERETEEETGLGMETRELLQNDGTEMVFRAELRGENRDAEAGWEGEPVWIPLEDAGRKRWRKDRDIRELLGKHRRADSGSGGQDI